MYSYLSFDLAKLILWTMNYHVHMESVIDAFTSFLLLLQSKV